MAQPATRSEFKQYCLRQLGAPVLEINLAEEQCEDLIDDSLQLWQERVFDGVLQTYFKYKFTQDDIDRGTATTADGSSNTAGITTTTASAEIARELYKKAKSAGFHFLDAPVSGGQAGAENGALTVMIGGDDEAYKKAEPVIDCYSKKVKLLGPSGSGQLAKMVNQICIAGLVQGLSEAINFGVNAGLKMEDVIEVISKGAAQSWQMENRHKTMIGGKFDYGFAVDWMRKDLKIAMEEAKRNNSPLPITKIIDEYYGEIQKMGGKRWDTSSLIKRFRK